MDRKKTNEIGHTNISQGHQTMNVSESRTDDSHSDIIRSNSQLKMSTCGLDFFMAGKPHLQVINTP